MFGVERNVNKGILGHMFAWHAPGFARHSSVKATSMGRLLKGGVGEVRSGVRRVGKGGGTRRRGDIHGVAFRIVSADFQGSIVKRIHKGDH